MGGCLYSRQNYNPHYYQDPLLDEYGDPQLGDPVDQGVYHQEWDRPFQDIHKTTDQYPQQNRLSDVFSSFTNPRGNHPPQQQYQSRPHAYTAHVGPANRHPRAMGPVAQQYPPYMNNTPQYNPPYERSYSGRLSTSSAGSGSHGSYGRQYSGHNAHAPHTPHTPHYTPRYSEHDSFNSASQPTRQQIQPQEEPVFPLTVRIQSLKSTYPVIEVRVVSSATVAVLKERICEATPDKIDPDRQRLVHRGRQLKDHKTMDEYSIQNGHTIMLVRSRHKSPAPSTTGSMGPADIRSRAYTSPAPDTLSPGIGMPDRSVSPALSAGSVDSGFNSDDPSYVKRRPHICSKCHDHPVGEFIVVPCGHKCLCDTCEANIQLKVDQCPQCVKENGDGVAPISSIVKIKG